VSEQEALLTVFTREARCDPPIHLEIKQRIRHFPIQSSKELHQSLLHCGLR
jgi:hypothetical protein